MNWNFGERVNRRSVEAAEFGDEPPLLSLLRIAGTQIIEPIVILYSTASLHLWLLLELRKKN